MSDKNQKVPQPPQPPQVERELEFYTWQLIGMAVIFLIPILALFGVFGESFGQTSSNSDQLALAVEYPTRYRYKMVNPLNITISNVSSQAIPTVTVKIDRNYISQFSEVTFTPNVETVTGEAYIVELTDVQPGEAREVNVSLQGEHYGWHEGFIRTEAGGAEAAGVSIETVIFP